MVFAPSRGRELKYLPAKLWRVSGRVRPLAGAGIEIRIHAVLPGRFRFAPSRGRELKSIQAKRSENCMVRPLAGAGIEIHSVVAWSGSFRFAPSRGRELK